MPVIEKSGEFFFDQEKSLKVELFFIYSHTVKPLSGSRASYWKRWQFFLPRAKSLYFQLFLIFRYLILKRSG
jgi:hypothetical protein